MIKVLHDLIKIQLSRDGYLPDYPPHLISDEEMCHAFFGLAHSPVTQSYRFFDYYPRPEGVTEEVDAAYTALVNNINECIVTYLSDDDPDAALPDWVYSYMLNIPVGPNSSELDRHNALVVMGMDNVYDELTPQVYQRCLQVSKMWIAKYGMEDRQPTVFIEPHVIKYFRLLNAV